MPPPSVSVRVSFLYYLVSCFVLISAQDYELDDKIKDSIKVNSDNIVLIKNANCINFLAVENPNVKFSNFNLNVYFV